MFKDEKGKLEQLLNFIKGSTITNYIALYDGSQTRSFEQKVWVLPHYLEGYNVQQLVNAKDKSEYYALISEGIEIHIEREESKTALEYRMVMKMENPDPRDVVLALTISYNRSKSKQFEKDMHKIAEVLGLKGIWNINRANRVVQAFKGGTQNGPRD